MGRVAAALACREIEFEPRFVTTLAKRASNSLMLSDSR